MNSPDPFLLKLISFIKPLPGVADRVLYLARQDPMDFKEITRVIETDPTLSTMVVSLANSPMYSPINKEITTLNRAIVLLGQARIMDSVMAYMTRGIREDSSEPWPLGDLNFWKHCISVGIAARMLAEKMQIPVAQQCFIAGLIHDVGKLALLNYDSSMYKKVISDVIHTQRPIEFIELGAFGVTHANLSGQISRHWKLPTHFTKAIGYHHDGPDQISGTLANVVRSANLIAKIAGYTESGNPYNAVSSDLLLPHPRLSQGDMQEIVKQLPEHVNELSKLILGSDSEEHEKTKADAAIKSKVVVSVRISNGEERVLLRYLVTALGYALSFGQLEEDEEVIHVDILDFLPATVPQDRHIIDFASWRENQRDMPDHRLDVKSLREWVAGKMAEITSAVSVA